MTTVLVMEDTRHLLTLVKVDLEYKYSRDFTINEVISRLCKEYLKKVK